MATLAQRARIALKAATGLFSDRAAQDTYGMLANLYRAQGEPPDRGAQGQLDAYSTMPRARSAFGLIAASMAAVDWKLYVARKGKGAQRTAYQHRSLQLASGEVRKQALREQIEAGDVEEVLEHPAIQFITGGSPLLPGVSSRRVQQLQFDLAGETFLLKGRNRLRAPVTAWPIPPTWVQGTPTPQHPFYQVSYRGWQAQIPDTEMLWIRDPDPANPYTRGVGYGKALADELEADEYASKTVRQLFFNRAQPDFLVFPKGEQATMAKSELLRFEQDWVNRLQGYWRAWKPYFLNREVGVHEFEKNFEHLQFTELRNAMRDIVGQTLGIPPELQGIVENSNRATIEAALLIFARIALVPRLEFWRSYYQTCLIPEYDERLIIDYVTPVTEDREFHLKVATAAPWAMDGNEWRALMGHPPKDEFADVHMLPLGGTPVSSDEIELGVAAEPTTHVIGHRDEGKPPEVIAPDDDEDEEPAGKVALLRG